MYDSMRNKFKVRQQVYVAKDDIEDFVHAKLFIRQKMYCQVLLFARRHVVDVPCPESSGDYSARCVRWRSDQIAQEWWRSAQRDRRQHDHDDIIKDVPKRSTENEKWRHRRCKIEKDHKNPTITIVQRAFSCLSFQGHAHDVRRRRSTKMTTSIDHAHGHIGRRRRSSSPPRCTAKYLSTKRCKIKDIIR